MKCFESKISEMEQCSINLNDNKVYLNLPHAEQILHEAFAYFLGRENRKTVWLPEYNQVCEWLADNQGKGLFMFGSCGRGKSLLCRYILPSILLLYFRKVASVFDVQAMNNNIDYVLSRHIVSLDDVGTEDISNIYGNKRMAFAEIMDAAEKQGKLIIVSTNLSVEDIRKQYGDRTLERIKATTHRVLFEGESLR
ncbi:MAG: hypothetical protein E6767_16260 [Dysgonomonas sp.]|nr:hypothetical protein [Dysgonomonas sp.]